MDNHHLSPDEDQIQPKVFTSINMNNPPLETHDHKKHPPFKIPRVHPQFRNEQVRPKTYDPVVVSLGPYHHGKPELRHAEIYKRTTMDQYISGSSHKDKFFFYGKIPEHIDDIRDCYEEEVIQEYDEEALAFMILHDACFIYITLQGIVFEPSQSCLSHFGGAGYNLIWRDMHLLENQIPFWIIKLLASDQGQLIMWDELLAEYLACTRCGPSNPSLGRRR